jgi:FKBP-type peptidyl-prolyl cis-trans isomerase (trigger factor)
MNNTNKTFTNLRIELEGIRHKVAEHISLKQDTLEQKIENCLEEQLTEATIEKRIEETVYDQVDKLVHKSVDRAINNLSREIADEVQEAITGFSVYSKMMDETEEKVKEGILDAFSDDDK